MQRYQIGYTLQRVVLYLMICLGIFALDGMKVFGPIKSQLERVYVAINQSTTQISRVITKPMEAIVNYPTTLERLQQLEARNLQSYQDRSRIFELEEENIALREQLNAPLPANWDYLSAKVLGINQGLVYLSIGSNQGVQSGDAVVYKDQLLGKLVNVSERISHMRLLTDTESRIGVRVRADERIDGIVLGKNGEIVLTQILQINLIESGQLVLTSGMDGAKPGLIVGIIDEIRSDSQGLYKEATITPLVDINQLETVFVIRSTD